MGDVETTPLPLKVGSNTWKWRLEDRGACVELKPRFNWGHLALNFGFGIPLWLAGYWFITRVVEVNDQDWMPRIWLFLFPAVLLVVCVILYSEFRFGPRFFVDRSRMTLTLPRLARTWPLEDVIGWQLVEYVREHDADQSPMSQVVLVVRSANGPERIRFSDGIGRSTARRFEQLLIDIERTTGMRRLA